MIRRPPNSPLFPSTTLFRSLPVERDAGGDPAAPRASRRHPDARLPLCDADGGRAQEGDRRDLAGGDRADRKSTRLNSSHSQISYAVFCLKKKKYIESHKDSI